MVSIIIPVYNAATYLRECLDSALSQTFRDIEVIAVDDGSTDGSPAILAEYAACDSRLTVVTQANRGVSAARNAALRLARGQWLTFLDSDDALYPRCVEMLTEAARLSGCDLVYGGWRSGRRFDPKGASATANPPEVMDRADVIEGVLYQTSGILPTPWGKLYRRRCLDGIDFEEGTIYEDLDLFYKVRPEADRIAILREPVYFYRDNPTSITNTFTPSRLDVLKVTARIEDYMASSLPALTGAARDRRLSACFNMYCLLAIHDRGGRYGDTAAECWLIIRSYRRRSLLDPRVRLKNKVGILLSYLGQRIVRAASRFVYKQ